jgi:hypothetical protein
VVGQGSVARCTRAREPADAATGGQLKGEVYRASGGTTRGAPFEDELVNN